MRAALAEALLLRERSKVMTQTQRAYPGPPGWGLGAGLTTHPANIFVTKLQRNSRNGKRSDVLGGGELKKPWPKLGCSTIGEKDELRFYPLFCMGLKFGRSH